MRNHGYYIMTKGSGVIINLMEITICYNAIEVTLKHNRNN